MQTNLSKRINEILVLAVLREGRAHGYQIALAVEEKTAGAFHFQHGTLYPILHRMEQAGWLVGEWDGGSRRRKTYRATADGRERLRREAEALRGQFASLLEFLEGADAA